MPRKPKKLPVVQMAEDAERMSFTMYQLPTDETMAITPRGKTMEYLRELVRSDLTRTQEVLDHGVEAGTTTGLLIHQLQDQTVEKIATERGLSPDRIENDPEYELMRNAAMEKTLGSLRFLVGSITNIKAGNIPTKEALNAALSDLDEVLAFSKKMREGIDQLSVDNPREEPDREHAYERQRSRAYVGNIDETLAQLGTKVKAMVAVMPDGPDAGEDKVVAFRK